MVAAGRVELLEIWLNPQRRQEVADASDGVDKQLSLDPATRGEPVAGELRMLTVEPLRVLFTVDDGHRRVIVIAVAVTS